MDLVVVRQFEPMEEPEATPRVTQDPLPGKSLAPLNTMQQQRPDSTGIQRLRLVSNLVEQPTGTTHRVITAIDM